MKTRKTQIATASNSKELAVELSNFNFELTSYEDEKLLVLSYNWTNKED